ncbi:hypoxanthine phosphoribosyltransferase [Nitrosospira multiformis ATCC 25196]|uniref:Hypoxanthine phosphoribosyltransferase n=2 Tax=Nitrosospira multiformis (strain ATCC 25196 / NCIMB 11849 / C 71) TaxID=323848 RepID=A0A1H5SRK8_NITMU|nr:hypoxanthine phosphoribosyltransferase [Nitrosospira multiformis ATCC 25196]
MQWAYQRLAIYPLPIDFSCSLFFIRLPVPMLPYQDAQKILREAEQIFPAEVVVETVRRMAADITATLAHRYPLVLSIMGGAVVFTGQLLPLLQFPLNFDYLHVSRYAEKMHGGRIDWKASPGENVQDRVVLVVDDILDQGITLAAIREWVMSQGAAAFYSAVFAEKDIPGPKPISADFVGLVVPNRYVFGFGMDIYGAWRNLPAIYALKE